MVTDALEFESSVVEAPASTRCRILFNRNEECLPVRLAKPMPRCGCNALLLLEMIEMRRVAGTAADAAEGSFKEEASFDESSTLETSERFFACTRNCSDTPSEGFEALGRVSKCARSAAANAFVNCADDDVLKSRQQWLL